MKADIHPKYNEVVFQDVTSDLIFLTRSTLTSKDTIKWEDGKEYTLVKVEVSSASHPFYTGKQKMMDTSRRVDKFRQRHGQGGFRQFPADGRARGRRRFRPAEFAGAGTPHHDFRPTPVFRGYGIIPACLQQSQTRSASWPITTA